MASASGSKQRGGKIPTSTQSNKQSDPGVLEAARRRVELERRAQKIVERLLDEVVSESFFEDCGKYITSEHFDDVPMERAIEKMCGYPLCRNKLKSIPRQQYHISLKTKKVYDITERKNFCSQTCYQAFKYYQAQLTDEPLWSRDHKSMPPIKLLERESTSTAGKSFSCEDAVVIKQPVRAADCDGSPESSKAEDKIEQDLSSLGLEGKKSKEKERQERLEKIAASVMRQKETVQSSISEQVNTAETRVAGHVEGSPQSGSNRSELPESGSNQGEPPQTGSDASTLEVCPDALLNSESVRTAVNRDDEQKETSQPEFPEISQQKPVQEAEPCSKGRDNSREATSRPEMSKGLHESGGGGKEPKSSEVTGSTAKASKKKKKGTKQQTGGGVAINPMLAILNHIQQCLLEWRTEDSLQYVYGQKDEPVPGQSPDPGECIPGAVGGGRSGIGQDDPGERPDKRALRAFEKQVGQRLDKEELDDAAFSPASKPLPDFDQLRREEEERYALRVREFFGGQITETTPNPNGQGAVLEQQAPPPVDRTMGLPPVDSNAQVTIRRKILLGKLGKVLPDLAVSLHISVRDVNPMITELIRTFRPGSHNIAFKPVGWTLLTIVLLYILAEREPRVKESLQSSDSRAFISSIFTPMGLKYDVIDDVIQQFKQGATR